MRTLKGNCAVKDFDVSIGGIKPVAYYDAGVGVLPLLRPALKYAAPLYNGMGRNEMPGHEGPDKGAALPGIGGRKGKTL